jgi:hypothetical protein
MCAALMARSPNRVGIRGDGFARAARLVQAITSDRWQPRVLRWESLLAAAGLANAQLAPADPRMTPASFADARAAWTGKHPDDSMPIHIEAAAYRGVPVFRPSPSR